MTDAIPIRRSGGFRSRFAGGSEVAAPRGDPRSGCHRPSPSLAPGAGTPAAAPAPRHQPAAAHPPVRPRSGLERLHASPVDPRAPAGPRHPAPGRGRRPLGVHLVRQAEPRAPVAPVSGAAGLRSVHTADPARPRRSRRRSAPSACSARSGTPADLASRVVSTTHPPPCVPPLRPRHRAFSLPRTPRPLPTAPRRRASPIPGPGLPTLPSPPTPGRHGVPVARYPSARSVCPTGTPTPPTEYPLGRTSATLPAAPVRLQIRGGRDGHAPSPHRARWPDHRSLRKISARASIRRAQSARVLYPWTEIRTNRWSCQTMTGISIRYWS